MGLPRSVLVVDDHPLFLDAVAGQVRRLFPDCSTTQTQGVSEALDALQQGRCFDLVITDYVLPDGDGIASIERLVAAAAPAPVIVMSGMAGRTDVSAMAPTGARAFLPKTLDSGLFASAIEVVMDGGIYFPPDVITAHANALVRGIRAVDFTERELVVLRLLADGQSNKMIGRALEIQESTVKLIVQRIFQKMNVNKRSQAVVLAVDAGLVPRSGRPK